MPVGPYPDFESCVRANSDKADPAAYCGALERDSRGTMTHIAMIVPEGVQTSDRRLIQPGALTWRENLPIMFQDSTTAEHEGAVHVGNAVNVRRETVEGQTWIVADVEWDTDDQAMEARRLADEDKIAGVSADIGGVSAELEITEVDEEGFPIVWLETITAGEIIGFTQLPMPAFDQARIMRTEMVATGRIVQAEALDTVTAAANPKAKREWFQDPELPTPTPLTVTDEGRVYGHLATWGTCHIGFDGACVTPPESSSEYKYFNLGAVTIDGEEIPCGHITLGTGHAELSADAGAAANHYDHTGSVAADVVAGEDSHGIWVSGACRPGADLDVLRSASLSGDWRRVEGNLELVAALAVNVPGFPVPRIAASVAAGEQLSLVASGVVERREREDLIYEALRLIHQEIKAMRADGQHVTKIEPTVTIQNGDDLDAPPNTAEEIKNQVVKAGRLAALLDS